MQYKQTTLITVAGRQLREGRSRKEGDIRMKNGQRLETAVGQKLVYVDSSRLLSPGFPVGVYKLPDNSLGVYKLPENLPLIIAKSAVLEQRFVFFFSFNEEIHINLV